MSRYVLLASARNEEDYIELTIKSVVSQTILPQKWIIMNDGSTDRTEEIIREYADEYPFIHLISVSGDQRRNFGSKAKALAYAYEQLQDVEYDFVGILDADVSFAPDYYENILAKFAENPRLGIAGGIRYDLRDGEFYAIPSANYSVCGAIQMFRRESFEKIGGYQTLPYGGIDAVAETSVRMHGWEVRSFREYRVNHHRPTGGGASKTQWRIFFRAGLRDYSIGYHPLFAMGRVAGRLRRNPFYIVQSFGYFYGMVRRIDHPVSKEFIAFLRQEQMGRIKGMFARGKGNNHR